MHDYNFFSDYIFVKSTFNLKKLIIPFVYLVTIGLVIGTYFYMENAISDLSEIRDDHQSIIDSKAFIDANEEVILLREEMATLRMMSEEVDVFSLLMTVQFPVTDDLVYEVLKATPRNVAFGTYNINEQGITISGTSTDYAYISEFESNLRQLFVFSDVYVDQISNIDDIYSFSISVLFGGELLD